LSVSVIRAITWTHLLDSGKFRSVEELASRLRLEVSFVRRVMKLASLAPDIVYGILDGREPEGLTVGLLRKGVPLSWEEQRRTLGFHQSGGPVPAPRR